MELAVAHLARIQKYANQVMALEKKLMSDDLIPMTEQQRMHAEILRLKAEIELLEKRTR